MIFKNQWNLAHNWSHSCQVQMAFVLFWTANIGHNCSIDYRQVLHFCLKVHFVRFLIIGCKKSNICRHIFLQHITSLSRLANNHPIAWVQVRCPCTFQTQSLQKLLQFKKINFIYSPASVIKLGKGKLGYVHAVYSLLPPTIQWQWWPFGCFHLRLLQKYVLAGRAATVLTSRFTCEI